MTQEKKNKRLLLILLMLIAVITALYFTEGSSDRVVVDKNLFVYANPAEIDKVEISGPEFNVKLAYQGRWVVNEIHQADNQRIQVLFAILQQISVRRRVSKLLQDSIKAEMDSHGLAIGFYSEGEKVKSFKVLGNEQSGLTYMQHSEDQAIYIVEIPGYHSYVAGIFATDQNGWRDPLIFDLNWGTLQQVNMVWWQQPANSFTVTFDKGLYKVVEVQETDTARLYDLLDNVARLYVEDYLAPGEMQPYQNALKDTLAGIVVKDVGRNNHTLEIYGELSEPRAFLVRVDSTDFGYVTRGKVLEVLKPKTFFIQEEK